MSASAEKERSLLSLCETEQWDYIENEISNYLETWDFEERNKLGYTPLLVCCAKGALPIVQLLYAKVPKINKRARSNKGETVTLLTSVNGHLDLLIWLSQNKGSLNNRDFKKRTCLILASKYNHLPIVEWLKKQGCSLDEVSNAKRTSIMYASKYGHLDVVKWLVKNKCSVFAKDEMRETCLAFAVVSGNIDLVKYLVKKKNGLLTSSVLTKASEIDKFEILKLLYSTKSLLNTMLPEDLKQSFEIASHKGHLHIVIWILQKTGFRKMKDYRHVLKDANLKAITAGHLDICKYFLESGCSLANKDTLGRESISSALNLGKIDIAKWLYYEKGFPVDKYFSYRMPESCFNGHLDIVRWGVELGYSLDIINTRGTCIMNAAVGKRVDVIVWLLNNGASLEENKKRTYKGIIEHSKSCEEILKENGLYEEVKFLLTTKSSRK